MRSRVRLPYSPRIKEKRSLNFEYNGSAIRFDSECIHVSRLSGNKFFDVLERARFLNLYHQQKKVNKSVWRMPWLSEAMKDVTGCDKFRLGAYNRLTRKFPNGETHLDEDQVSCEQSWEANPEN